MLLSCHLHPYTLYIDVTLTHLGAPINTTTLVQTTPPFSNVITMVSFKDKTFRQGPRSSPRRRQQQQGQQQQQQQGQQQGQAQQAQQHDIDNNQHDAVARPEDAFVEFVEEDNNANVNVITQRGGDEEDNEEDEANEEEVNEEDNNQDHQPQAPPHQQQYQQQEQPEDVAPDLIDILTLIHMNNNTLTSPLSKCCMSCNKMTQQSVKLNIIQQF